MRRVTVLALVALASACAEPEPPRPSFTEAESHSHYAAALGEFGLDKAALGREWLAAADQALADPVTIGLPFQETGYLPPSEPLALAYRFDLDRGRVLAIDVEFDGGEPTRLFIQLFEMREGREPRLVAEAAPSDRALSYEARSTGSYVLRLQPELLKGGRVTVRERSMASLGFPVQGLSLAAVQSVFGDPRDGGVRDHHGVDIFAPRGTPVLAAVDGSVRVDTGNRGGRLIWLYPSSSGSGSSPRTRRRGGARLYYAHLNDWAVEDGATVQAGDVIGYVGNTGNARTTPPHLHFGVYDRGAVDPAPFLRPDDPEPERVSGSLELIDDWVRVSRSQAALRESASSRSPVRMALDADLVLHVRAASAGYYRVAAPDGVWGYVAVRDVEPASEALSSLDVLTSTYLRSTPDERSSVLDVIEREARVDVLGRFGAYDLVRLPDARQGWIAAVVDDRRP